ncbi:MAG: 5-methylthioadenosine nucleosidase [Myxococcales bacterium]|nr:5-methylthioadenosine nucleosidase [Myxococcales bacterium]
MLEGVVRTLIVAAYAPELGAIAGRAVGIGLVAASAGAVRALAEERPDRVIFVGTAGALPGSGLAVGSVVVAARARLIVRPEEYVPSIMAVEVEAPLAEECGARLDVPRVTVACGVGITSSDVEAERLGALAEVEHLESFAVLMAAMEARVPATAVLAIANSVGSRAQAEWRANRVGAEAAAMAAVTKLLELLL